MKTSELNVVMVVFGVIMVGVLWNINNQMNDIKFRSFRMGCMDSHKIDYATCSGLAKQYVDGTLDISKLEKYNAR
jgi:hypothetical protein